MRLDKYISNSGYATRSEVKKLLKSGIVTVNGEISKKADLHIDEHCDTVKINGTEITYNKYVYLMLNKPKGFISATEDKKYRVVTELVDERYRHYNVFPVGRLDIDTEGLLILSNDGGFAHNLTSPKKNVYKKYFAVLDKDAEDKDIEEFEKGMEFDDFKAKSAILTITDKKNEVYIEIAEGKFHQVKRMCKRVGKEVLYLKRVSIGGLELDENLPLGRMRELTKDELESIFA
ncbi:MAG: rRNA pseudouridine synthase [Clostridia bacterium]|nr:rRNA pseudouridine synthase [Clostridia bacterium]